MHEPVFRYHLIDSLRGLTLVSMVLYHLAWSLVYPWQMDWQWYQSDAAYFWQQSISWGFIFISGFSWPLGTRPFRRGIVVFLAGGLITVVTTLAIPDQQILFGVLTMLGSAMLLTIPLAPLLEKVPPVAGLAMALLLFVITRDVNLGYLGFEGMHLYPLSDRLYHGHFMTFLGFPQAGFSSADYFSLFPWYFLYLVGFFSCHLAGSVSDKERLPSFFEKGVPPLGFLGRHSLIIYLVHQPVIFLLLTLVDIFFDFSSGG